MPETWGSSSEPIEHRSPLVEYQVRRSDQATGIGGCTVSSYHVYRTRTDGHFFLGETLRGAFRSESAALALATELAQRDGCGARVVDA